MPSLPQDWQALCLLIFVLGLKHGFDADHLATIDGLTRVNQRRHPRLARFCGALFSLGHGGVVLVIALFVGTLAQRWQAPPWLDEFGAWVSISILSLLGLVNIRAVLVARPHEVVRPVGIKGRLLGRARTASLAWVALIGALFALSFDTVSQATLFALAASQSGGWERVMALGLLFTAGMIVTDGANGLWIARLIRRADQRARIASRVMGLVVGSASLLTAAFVLARLVLPPLDAWSEGKELSFGFVVIAFIAIGAALAFAMASLARKARVPVAEEPGGTA